MANPTMDQHMHTILFLHCICTVVHVQDYAVNFTANQLAQ